MNRKKKWKLVTAALILITAWTSCTSTPKSSGIVPDPYDQDGNSVVKFYEHAEVTDQDTQETTQAEDLVTMPLWFWKKVVRYIIDTE